jgi:hypothetical protein
MRVLTSGNGYRMVRTRVTGTNTAHVGHPSLHGQTTIPLSQWNICLLFLTFSVEMLTRRPVSHSSL